MADKPIKALDVPTSGENGAVAIPRKQKPASSQIPALNGNGDDIRAYKNGVDSSTAKRKADEALATEPVRKRLAPESLEDRNRTIKRVKAEGPISGDLIVLEDGADGAIVIQDD